MPISNKDSYIRGNTVLVPEYNPSKDYKDEKYKKLEKAKKEAQIKQKKQKTKGKVGVLKVIAFTFVVGVFLLYRYASIFSMEASLTKSKAEVANLRAENESLRVTISEKRNINVVQAYAVSNLNMVKPDAIDAIKVDLNKNNFKIVNTTNNNASPNIFDKIIKVLF